jgi:hypothetical protein
MIGVGEKFKADTEKQRYTIMAKDDRFVIMIKPFNAKKTYLYSIIDLKRKVRGPNNLIFGPIVPFNTLEGAAENLKMLQNKEQEVSYRRCIDLSTTEIQQLIKE